MSKFGDKIMLAIAEIACRTGAKSKNAERKKRVDKLRDSLHEMRESLQDLQEIKMKEIGTRKNVPCKVCSEEFPIISEKHLKTHGLTIAEYQQKYPGAPLMGKAKTFGELYDL